MAIDKLLALVTNHFPSTGSRIGIDMSLNDAEVLAYAAPGASSVGRVHGVPWIPLKCLGYNGPSEKNIEP